MNLVILYPHYHTWTFIEKMRNLILSVVFFNFSKNTGWINSRAGIQPQVSLSPEPKLTMTLYLPFHIWFSFFSWHKPWPSAVPLNSGWWRGSHLPTVTFPPELAREQNVNTDNKRKADSIPSPFRSAAGKALNLTGQYQEWRASYILAGLRYSWDRINPQ